MNLNRRDASRLFLAALSGSTFAFGDDESLRILEQARQACWGKAGKPPHDYSYRLVTELEIQGRRVQIASKVSLVLPNTFRQEVESPGGIVVLLFDGKEAWRQSAGGKQKMPESASAAQASDLSRRHVLFTEAPAAAWVRMRGNERLDGKEVKVIEIADVGGSPLRLFLDPQSFNVVKTVYVGDVPSGGMAQVEEFLSDYREIDGYRWAHKRRLLRNGTFGQLQTLSDVKVNLGLSRSDILS